MYVDCVWGSCGLESGKNRIVILEYSELGSLADSEGKFKGCGGEWLTSIMDGILGEDEAQESQREEGAKGSLGLPLLREIQVGNGVKG